MLREVKAKAEEVLEAGLSMESLTGVVGKGTRYAFRIGQHRKERILKQGWGVNMLSTEIEEFDVRLNALGSS